MSSKQISNRLLNLIFYLGLIFLALSLTGIIAPIAVAYGAGMENAQGSTSSISPQERAYSANTKISALINNQSQTRISFGSLTIKEVIGDTSRYYMVHDGLAKSIFITPKVKAGEKIDISIVTSCGKIQDMLLVVSLDPCGAIVIRNTTDRADTTKDLKEASLMLRSMVFGKKGKYDVTDLTSLANGKRNRKAQRSNLFGGGVKTLGQGILLTLDTYNTSYKAFRDLEIRENKVYQYKASGLRGVILEIINRSKKSKEFMGKDLDEIFPGTLITHVKSTFLAPKSSIYAFVVFRDKEDKDGY